MIYTPKNWNFAKTESGDKVYEDHVLNIVQENLKTAYQLVDDVVADAKINILFVQNNVNTKTVRDSTAQAAGFWFSKLIEGLGVVFTAGTPAAIIATITCKIISGIATKVTTPENRDSYNAVQSKANDLKDMVEEMGVQIQLELAKCIEDLEHSWTNEYKTPGAKYPEFRGISKIADLAGSQEEPNKDYLPKKPSTEYTLIRRDLNKFSTYEAAASLIPVKWRIRDHRAFPSDGISNFLRGWQVAYYKVYRRGNWDDWHGRAEFPAIPGDLSDDVQGPFQDIERSQKGSEWQRFLGYSGYCKDYHWSNNGDNRWMYWSGERQQNVNDKLDIIEGTSFLDLIQDILDGKYFGYGQWSEEDGFPNRPSYFLWYKTKKPGENIEIINDKREYTLLDMNCAIDWAYDSYDIFHWGRAYRGIALHHYYLVDENGGHASAEFCHWLFKDNGHGKVTNENGVAGMIDVYHNWGISIE